MKKSIQDLVAEGKTIEAIESLMSYDKTTALLLQSRHTTAKRNYNLGMIGFAEFQMINAQVSHAIIDLASNFQPILSVQNNFIFINNVQAADKPGNEYDLFFQTFEAMERMVDRLNYPHDEVLALAKLFHKYFGNDFIGPVDELQSTKYGTNSEAYKESRKEAIVAELLTLKKEILAEFKTEIKQRKKETGWAEIWQAFRASPTSEKWKALKDAIDNRFGAAIFTNDQRETWGQLSADIDGVSEGFLWVSRFNRSYASDLTDFISANLK